MVSGLLEWVDPGGDCGNRSPIYRVRRLHSVSEDTVIIIDDQVVGPAGNGVCEFPIIARHDSCSVRSPA